MKITRLQAQNVLTLTDIDIRVEKPIVMLAAANGAGKSSIVDAVRMAFSRTIPRGVVNKKDYGILLNDTTGTKAGGVLITCDDDHDKTFGVVLPKGEFTGPELPDAMAVALDGQRFSRMTPDERRTFLFRLTKSGAKSEDVRGRLLLGGCRPELVDQVLPMLRAGFPKAEEFAKEEAKGKKSEWKAITATTWGSSIGENWKAPVPDEKPGDAAALRAQAAVLDQQVATLNQSLGEIKQAQRQATEAVQKRASLEAAAKRVPELEQLLVAAIKDRDDYQVKVEALRERAKGKARVGLVHDMARFILTVADMEISSTADELMARYEQEHGPLTTGAAPDPDAVASLPEHEKGLTVLINRAANLQRDLDSARMAKGQYDALAPADDAVDATAELAEVQRMLDEARAASTKAMNQALDIEAATKGRADAQAKTEKAQDLHGTVMAWLKIAEYLAPSGIPAQILADALKIVNDKLVQAHLDSDWPLVSIEQSMEIEISRDKARPYAMESKSYQWRADAHIAAVVAQQSGLGVLVLDEADILEPSARPSLFSWLDTMVSEGDLETVILAMTLKAKPEKTLPTFQVEWIEAGAIAGAAQEAAA